MVYNLYTIIMNDSRTTLTSPTNILLPINVLRNIAYDCGYFNISKNNQASIGGFLNQLIPELYLRRKDLHRQLLQYFDYDETLTTKSEEGLYKVFFNKDDFCDDAMIKVPFRVNESKREIFLEIYDIELGKHNTDFSNYVRNLLIEYCSKQLDLREYCFYYSKIQLIKEAIENGYLCHFHLEDRIVSMIPVAIDFCFATKGNLIAGMFENMNNAFIFALKNLKKVVVDKDISIRIDDECCDFVNDFINEYNNELLEEK